MAVSITAPATTQRARVPARVGPYRVIGLLGSGGMGVVYRAVDTSSRSVAIKVLRPDLGADPEFLARFRREVDITKRVRGACTAQVLAADLDGPQPYLVSEYVEGPTLGDYVQANGPLTGEALKAFAVGLAEALHAIHSAGVVHRDLTPSNVVLSPAGPKVLDFGIARHVDSTALTHTNIMMGTPSWLPPEQARGQPVTSASDVFCWGALIAYAASGVRPFGEGRPEAVMYRIVHEQPAVPGLPNPVDALVAAALAKNPQDRPTPLGILRTLLEPWAVTGAVEAQVTAVLDRTWRIAPLLTQPMVAPESYSPQLARRRRIASLGGVALAVVLIAIAGLLAQTVDWPTLVNERRETSPRLGAAAEQEDHAARLPVAEPVAPRQAEVRVPHVEGFSGPKARSRLKDAGFIVAVRRVVDDTVEPGTVISQRPRRNVVAPEGSKVALVLAKAPPIVSTEQRVFSPWDLDELRPGLSVAEEVVGECWSGSNLLMRDDAWRCIDDSSSIGDPCFQNPVADVVACGSTPWDDEVRLMHLSKSLPYDMKNDNSDSSIAWALELANGQQCSFIQGAGITVGGMRLNYSCDGGDVYGDIDKTSEQWQVYYQAAGESEMAKVGVKVVWF